MGAGGIRPIERKKTLIHPSHLLSAEYKKKKKESRIEMSTWGREKVQKAKIHCVPRRETPADEALEGRGEQ